MRKPLQPVVGLVLAAVAAASMWFYVMDILRARQIAEAEAKQIPRGNLSDLYPRWLGARELLVHRRNPYSREVTLEIQEGYYGRRLDAARPNDPKDQQGFAYPVYVAFLLAPLVGIPFPALLVIFYWSLVLLTGASVWLWLRTLRWRLPLVGLTACMVLTLGSFPAVQGIKLQQLSLLVAALLAGSSACVASGFLFCGGVLLALATIKPQLAWPLVGWLLLWAIGDWRGRRKLVFGFGLTMILLLGGAEIVLPGWWRMFAEAIGQYRHYTQSQSVLEVMLNQIFGSAASGGTGRLGGQILAAIAVIACVPLLWKLRVRAADASGFSCATALTLALAVLVVPMYAPYNQVLLLPAILLLVRERAAFLSRSRGRRLACRLGALVLGWQWVASLGLTMTYWLVSRDLAFRGWEWPFFATFALPVWVFALIFFYVNDECRRVQERLV
ncbi:MAG TPA: glycosyltransferase family 87 protein [Candidatus Sulfotelmatobacter sp.]|nr:glycosyltransferase family 87 protein [Candidatus Sulfotelmatobacter sp.]